MNKNIINNSLVSIIIRTKNEEEWIFSCLESIFNQNYKNLEVIIVDNYSKDNTVKIAKEFNVKILKIKNYLPGKALNYGIKNAKGKFIVCLSGHCIPVNKRWLSNLVKNLKNKKIAGCYGRQQPLSFSSDFDKRDLINLFGLDKKIQTKDSFFHNANSAFRKDLWKKFPFDEKLTNIEDRVWAQNVLLNNYKLIYEPKASVYHWHGIHHNMNKDRARNVVKILESIQHKKRLKAFNLKKINVLCVIPTIGDLIKIGENFLLKNTIDCVFKSKHINKVVIATDNKKTVKVASNLGIKNIIVRPKYLSENYIDEADILNFVLQKIKKTKKENYDLVVCLKETYPFRSHKVIDDMIEKISKTNIDTILACKEERRAIWISDNQNIKLADEGVMPRKFKKEKTHISLAGYCYITHPHMIESSTIFSGLLGIYPIKDSLEGLEIKDRLTNNKYLKHIINLGT